MEWNRRPSVERAARNKTYTYLVIIELATAAANYITEAEEESGGRGG